MYKKQVSLFKLRYMINDNENKVANEKQITQRYDINIFRLKHGHKYAKCKMCLIIMMVIGIKPYLSNI